MTTHRVPARWATVWIVLGTLLLIASVTAAFWVQQGRIDVGAHRYDNLSQKYDRLFTQYSRLYGDCAESSNCEPTAPAPEAIPAGPQGKAGPAGPAGRDATEDQIAAAVRDYCDARLGCAGTPGVGTPGRDGADGADGKDGTDGQTIVGPPGPVGATGETGATGPAGADGQPPLSWTYTDPLGIPYSCSRTDPFDPTAPTYACAQTPIGEPK